MKFKTKFLKGNGQRLWNIKTFITNNIGLQKTIVLKSTTSEMAKLVHAVLYIALFANESNSKLKEKLFLQYVKIFLLVCSVFII